MKQVALRRKTPLPRYRGARRATRRRPAGEFPLTVREQIRDRAGGRCEACGHPLGYYGGQLQHRLARGMGGTRDPLLASAVNGVLLCGTPQSGCHGACEDRDPAMRERGFWLRRWQNPAAVPVRIWDGYDRPERAHLGTWGCYLTAWLTPAGNYAASDGDR